MQSAKMLGWGGPNMWFAKVPEPKTAKNRLHFDVCPTDRGQEDELARLLDVGARRSNIVGSGSWVVLEDPEGNELVEAVSLAAQCRGGGEHRQREEEHPPGADAVADPA